MYLKLGVGILHCWFFLSLKLWQVQAVRLMTELSSDRKKDKNKKNVQSEFVPPGSESFRKTRESLTTWVPFFAIVLLVFVKLEFQKHKTKMQESIETVSTSISGMKTFNPSAGAGNFLVITTTNKQRFITSQLGLNPLIILWQWTLDCVLWKNLTQSIRRFQFYNKTLYITNFG